MSEEIYGSGIYRPSDDNFNASKFAQAFEFHLGQSQIFIKFLTGRDEQPST